MSRTLSSPTRASGPGTDRPPTARSGPAGSRPRALVALPSLDPLAAKLAALGLDYPASCLPELVEEATREALSATAFLDLLLTRQLERKDERRVQTMLKLSGLPPGKTLEDFDWHFQAAVTALLDRLLHHAHILKCGPRSWRTRLHTDLRVE